jgi:hypothetical protein
MTAIFGKRQSAAPAALPIKLPVQTLLRLSVTTKALGMTTMHRRLQATLAEKRRIRRRLGRAS